MFIESSSANQVHRSVGVETRTSDYPRIHLTISTGVEGRGYEPCRAPVVADLAPLVVRTVPACWRVFCHESRIDAIRPCRRLGSGLVGEPDVCRPEIVVRRARFLE
jgi:hypothetical protein